MKLKERWRDVANKLWSAFELDLFTVNDARAVLGLSENGTRDILTRLTNEGLVKKIEIAGRKDGLSFRNPNIQVGTRYTFDFDKTIDDVLETFDPIPRDKIALKPQLFGEELVRKREVDEYKLFGIVRDRSPGERRKARDA